MKPQLTLALDDGRQSSIFIGTGYLAKMLGELDFKSRVAVVSNPLVAPLFASYLGCLPDDHELILIGDGEEYKSLDSYSAVMDELVANRFNRDATIIALGGGVVGDLAGFVAATYQRGVRLIQIPTTLLAQVDSAIGGKTAVNHADGKNLIGAFYQPETVIIDTETLSTLPPKVYREGLAEVIKYGVIYDAEFFAWLEDNAQAVLARDSDSLQFIVRRSCEIKAAIVAADEREQGQRAILNYGHTFGHALEAEAGYGQLLHGEAVSVGMVMAADLALRESLCDARTALRIKNIVKAYRLPFMPPELDKIRFLDHMAMDKKVQRGEFRFVLPERIGSVVVTGDYAPANLDQTLCAYEGLCQ